MLIVTLILSIIILSFYIGQILWIFKDSRKRQDELIVVWCLLSLISFPIVLIIYIILTRSNKESYTCSNCSFKVKGSWKFCPNCNHDLNSNNKQDKFENMNKSISMKSSIGALPIVIFVAGIVLFSCFLTFSILNIKNSFDKVTVPGNTTINLKHKGEYTIFYEYKNNEEALLDYSELKIWISA